MAVLIFGVLSCLIYTMISCWQLMQFLVHHRGMRVCYVSARCDHSSNDNVGRDTAAAVT